MSAPPVQEALGILEKAGCIGPALTGKGRTILIARPQREGKRLLVCMPVPRETTNLTHQVQWELEPALEKLVISWHPVRRAERRVGAYLTEIAALRKTFEISGAIGLDVPHRELREAVGPSIPLLQIASLDYEDSRASAIAVDLAELFRAGLPHLFRLRYLKIGLICPFRPTTRNRLLGVIQEVHRLHRIPFSAAAQFPEVQVDTLSRTVRQMLAGHRFDLLLTVQDEIWSRVLWELNATGMRIPVLNLWNTSNFRMFENPPCLLELRMAAFSKAVRDWAGTIDGGKPLAFRRKVGIRIVFRI